MDKHPFTFTLLVTCLMSTLFDSTCSVCIPTLGAKIDNLPLGNKKVSLNLKPQTTPLQNNDFKRVLAPIWNPGPRKHRASSCRCTINVPLCQHVLNCASLHNVIQSCLPQKHVGYQILGDSGCFVKRARRQQDLRYDIRVAVITGTRFPAAPHFLGQSVLLKIFLVMSAHKWISSKQLYTHMHNNTPPSGSVNGGL